MSLLFSISDSNAQDQPIGAVSASLNYSSVTITDYWANNQANMVNHHSGGAAIYYENRFMMSELSTRAVTIFSPIGRGITGIKYSYFGYEFFNDQLIGIYYARKIIPNLSVGVQLDLKILEISESEPKICATFEIGLNTKLNDKLSIGLWTYNPIGIKSNTEKALSIIRTGLKWDISESVFTTVEAEKNTHENEIVLRAGAQYDIHDMYFFRIGTSTSEQFLSFGAGFSFHRFSLNLSSFMHNILGVSMQFGITYSFK